MPRRSFVVVTLPARDTILGALSAQSGCRIEGVARRSRRHNGVVFELAFQARAIAAETAHGVAAEMKAFCGEWGSVVDPSAMLWDARCALGLEQIRSRTLRALGGHQIAVEPAWFVIDHGMIELRLRPHAPEGIESVARRCRDLTRDIGIHWDIAIVAMDADERDRRVQELERMFPAQHAGLVDRSDGVMPTQAEASEARV